MVILPQDWNDWRRMIKPDDPPHVKGRKRVMMGEDVEMGGIEEAG